LQTPTEQRAREIIVDFVDQLKREIGYVNYDIHQADAKELWKKAISRPEVQSLGEMPRWLEVLGEVLRYDHGHFQEFLIHDRQLTREAKETIVLKVLVSVKRGEPVSGIVHDIFDGWVPEFRKSEAIYGVLGSGGWEAEVHKINPNGPKSFPVKGLRFIYETILGMPIDPDLDPNDHIEYVGRPALSWQVQNEKIEALIELGFLPLHDDRGVMIYSDLQYNGIVPKDLLPYIKEDRKKIKKYEPERTRRTRMNDESIGLAPAESEYIDFAKIFLFTSRQRLEYWRDGHSALILRPAFKVPLPQVRYRLSTGSAVARLQYPRGDVSLLPYSDFKMQNHTMQVLHGLMIDYLLVKHQKISHLGPKDTRLVRSLAALFKIFMQGTDEILARYGLDRRKLGLHLLSNDRGTMGGHNRNVFNEKNKMMQEILGLRQNVLLEDEMREHVDNILDRADSLLISAANKAMLISNPIKKHRSDTGGIDLSPAQMSLQVKHQGENFRFDYHGIEINAAQVVGIDFTIRHIEPVKNLPQILGLN